MDDFTLSSKQNQNQNQLHLVCKTFPARVSKLQEIPWNPDWFIALFAPVVIGWSNYIGYDWLSAVIEQFSNDCRK